MRHLLQGIYDALVAYGPWGVFLLSVIDSVGIPLPAAIDALVITVAAGSAHEPSRAYLTALIAVIGSTGGNVVLFQAARHGRRLFSSSEPPPGKRRRFREWFHRYGLMTVFVPAIMPVPPLPLKVFVLSAGAFHTRFVKFLAVVLTARVIRYFGEAYLGIQLGKDAQAFLLRNGWWLTGIVLAVVIVLVLVMRSNDRRRTAEMIRQQAALGDQPEVDS